MLKCLNCQYEESVSKFYKSNDPKHYVQCPRCDSYTINTSSINVDGFQYGSTNTFQTQEETKPNKLLELWNKTIFPDMIKNYKEKKDYQRRLKIEQQKMMMEAQLEATVEMKDEIKKVMIEKEKKKLAGEDKQEKLQKFADLFSMGRDKQGNQNKVLDAFSIGGRETKGPKRFDTNKKLKEMLR